VLPLHIFDVVNIFEVVQPLNNFVDVLFHSGVQTLKAVRCFATTQFNCIESMSAQVAIGGLFAPVSADGVWDVDQAQHLAAFVMAVNDINNKTDGIFDDILPNTKLVFSIQDPIGAVETAAAVSKWGEAFNKSGVFGVVTAQPSDEVVIDNLVAADSKIIQVSSVGQDTRLNEYIYFPYKLMTVPVDSYEGLVMQSVLCSYFNARRLVVITDSGYVSRSTVNELLDASYCTFEVLAAIEMRTADDFSWTLEEAKASGSRYFAMILQEPAMAAGLLELAYATGAFGDNSVIVTTEGVAGSVFTYLTPEADVSNIMRGLFGVKYWPDFSLHNTATGSSFVKRFAAQKSRNGVVANGKRLCDDSMDDNREFYLYRARTNASFCTGLDFNSFASSTSRIDPFPALTYDAVFVLATVLDLAIENQVDIGDVDKLFNIAVGNVSFQGVTGLFEIDTAVGDFQTFARGNREVGLQYYVINFNEQEYAKGNEPMVPIGNWSDGQFSLCSETPYGCFHPVFRNGFSEVIPDWPSAVHRTLSMGTQSAVYAVGAIGFLALVFLTVVTVKYRTAKQIKASQPVMLFTILTGSALAVSRGLLGIVDATNEVCSARVFVGHLAFAVLFGSLFVKSWRVHVLVNSKALKRIKFTATQAFLLLLQIVAVFIVYLVILLVVGKPQRSFASLVLANQEYLTPRCAFHINEFETALMVLEAVFLLYGFRICWNIRNVPDAFNESMSIAQGTNKLSDICCGRK
jgi:hypothetical protein